MKIQELTHTRITLHHRPVGSWLAGGCCTVFGVSWLIGLFGFVPAHARLTCDRSQLRTPVCQLTKTPLLGKPNAQKLMNLQSAYVFAQRRSKGGTTYRVELIDGAGEISMLEGSSQRTNDVANQINQFIATPEQNSFSVDLSGRSETFLISLFGFVGGAIGVVLLTTPEVNCTFYKSLNQVMLTKKNWQRTEKTEYPLNQLLWLEIEERKNRRGVSHRPIMVLDAGRRIPLTADFTRVGEVNAAVVAINDFLRLPSKSNLVE